MNIRQWLIDSILLLLRAARVRNGLDPIHGALRPEPVEGVYEEMEE